MVSQTWITSTVLFLAGAYLLYVEIGLEEKTPLLFVGILLLVPLVVQLLSTLKK